MPASRRLRPVSRRERGKSERRSRLAGAALALFAEKGFDATTVEEVAARADVAKGTFFNYFPSKRAVLVDYYEALDGRFFGALARLDPARPERSLARYYRWAERTLRAEGRLARVLFEAIAAQPDLGALDRESGREVEGQMARFLAASRQGGHLRPGTDPELAAAVLSDLWSATVRTWFEGDRVGSLARTLTTKLRIVFRGLAAPRPRHGKGA